MTLSRGVLERLNLYVFQGRTMVDVFQEMLNELHGDLKRAQKEARLSSDQYHRRTYLRALISYSEAIVFQLKQYLSDQREHLGIKITPNEEMILDEKSVEMTEKGTLKHKPLMVSHHKNLRFTLNFIAARLELSQTPDFSGTGWTDYAWAIDKRNDLTHPKYPSNIQISDEELARIDRAEEWLDKEFAKLMNGWAAKSKEAHAAKKAAINS